MQDSEKPVISKTIHLGITIIRKKLVLRMVDSLGHEQPSRFKYEDRIPLAGFQVSIILVMQAYMTPADRAVLLVGAIQVSLAGTPLFQRDLRLAKFQKVRHVKGYTPFKGLAQHLDGFRDVPFACAEKAG